MKQFNQMQSEKIRIQHSILKIKSFKQVAPTFKWINIFEKKFNALNTAECLRLQLREVQL
jgi:hypothetical protein